MQDIARDLDALQRAYAELDAADARIEAILARCLRRVHEDAARSDRARREAEGKPPRPHLRIVSGA